MRLLSIALVALILSSCSFFHRQVSQPIPGAGLASLSVIKEASYDSYALSSDATLSRVIFTLSSLEPDFGYPGSAPCRESVDKLDGLEIYFLTCSFVDIEARSVILNVAGNVLDVIATFNFKSDHQTYYLITSP